MKFVLQILIIAVAAGIAQWFFPWWSMAVVAFLAGYLFKSTQNFLAGFLAVALLWSGYAYLLDTAGAAPLADRVAEIIRISKPLLFAVTALLGGLVGGFAALTGSLLKKDKRKSLYY